MSNISDYRRSKNKCESRWIETRKRVRSWICNLTKEHGGKCETRPGHREWTTKGPNIITIKKGAGIKLVVPPGVKISTDGTDVYLDLSALRNEEYAATS